MDAWAAWAIEIAARGPLPAALRGVNVAERPVRQQVNDMTDERSELLIRTQQLFDEHRFGVLCTSQSSGAPYGNLVAVAEVDDLQGLLFATLRTTRKWDNLTAEPRVALVMDNRTNEVADLREALGVTAIGTAREVTDATRVAMRQRYLDKHPQLADFLATPECALMRIDVKTLITVTRFQQVVEIHFETSHP